MDTCYIVGASCEVVDKFEYDDSDYIIASDGGLKYLVERNYRVNLVVGDFDSLKRIPNEYKMVLLPEEKDITDTHQSILEGIKLGYHKFVLIGCLGGRIDQSIATISDSYHFVKMGNRIELLTPSNKISFLYNSSIEISSRGFVSIFALDTAEGVNLKGFKYPLTDALLTNDFPLGVSNEIVTKKATISVKNGCLLIVSEY